MKASESSRLACGTTVTTVFAYYSCCSTLTLPMQGGRPPGLGKVDRPQVPLVAVRHFTPACFGLGFVT
jgi:hypothetical protein